MPLYDPEARDTEEEVLQLYRSRRMRNKNRAVTGRQIGTGVRSVDQKNEVQSFCHTF